MYKTKTREELEKYLQDSINNLAPKSIMDNREAVGEICRWLCTQAFHYELLRDYAAANALFMTLPPIKGQHSVIFSNIANNFGRLGKFDKAVEYARIAKEAATKMQMWQEMSRFRFQNHPVYCN